MGFSYYARWPWSVEEYGSVVASEGGESLIHDWVVARVRSAELTLDEDDRAAIARHEHRNYGDSPLTMRTYCVPRPPEPDLAGLIARIRAEREGS